MPSKAIPFVMKKDYIQVIVDKKPFSLQSSHPTFKKLQKALKDKNWSKIPDLISLAKTVFRETQGDVVIENGKVFYKSHEIHNSLSKRIEEVVRQGKDVKSMLKFMNNLYQNPSELARNEFYDWLVHNELPITDNGLFFAYKSVNWENKDTHTNTIDNSPGQIILGDRDWFNENFRVQCASGYHVCSKQYGIYGSKTMAVLVNPRDVLSAVDGKMRVVNYEVISELGTKNEAVFRKEGFSELEGKLIVEIKKDRQAMLRLLLESPVIKRLFKKKKLSKKTLVKSSFARLKLMVQRYNLVPDLGPEPSFPLEHARKAAGLTQGQIAKEMKEGLRTVMMLEKKENPNPDLRNKFLLAIVKLRGSTRAVTYPKPVAA